MEPNLELLRETAQWFRGFSLPEGCEWDNEVHLRFGAAGKLVGVDAVGLMAVHQRFGFDRDEEGEPIHTESGYLGSSGLEPAFGLSYDNGAIFGTVCFDRFFKSVFDNKLNCSID